MIPVPFILFGIRPVFAFLRKTKLFRGLVDRLTKKSQQRSKDPETGALALGIVVYPSWYRGVECSLIAALLDMRFKYAFPAILIGNLIAGLIIMSLSTGAFALLAN